MASIIRQQKSSLADLEQVRQHIARLPSIGPVSMPPILSDFPDSASRR